MKGRGEMIGFPCKDCLDRYIGCHSECRRYKNKQEEIERIRRTRRKHYDIENYVVTQKSKNIEVARKRKVK